jgi:hypothetical protein
LENTCPTADPEKEMEKKRVGCAMLNLREMLSNSNKGKKVQVSVWDWIFCWVFGIVGIYFFASFSRKLKIFNKLK